MERGEERDGDGREKGWRGRRKGMEREEERNGEGRERREVTRTAAK